MLGALTGGLEGFGLELIDGHGVYQLLDLRLDQVEKGFISQAERDEDTNRSVRQRVGPDGIQDRPDWITHQSVEAHESTANKPLRTLCTVSGGTSGLPKKPITCFITLASRRIKPITTHHSKQPASVNTWRRYLKGRKQPFSAVPAGRGERRRTAWRWRRLT